VTVVPRLDDRRLRRLCTVGCVVLFYAGLIGVSVHSTFSGTSTSLALGSAPGHGLIGAAGTQESSRAGLTNAGAQTESATGGVTSVAGGGGGVSGAAVHTPFAAGSGPARAAVGMGQGVTDKTIKIGIETNKPISYGAFGGKGTSTDQVPSTKAVVDYINTHGGIAGRQIVPVFYSIDVTSGTFAEEAQAACTSLAEDNKVFVALSITDGIPEPACYASHGVPYFDQRRFLQSESDLAHYPDTFYLVGRLLTGERWARAWIDSLASQHFFDGAKLGIMRYDGADWNRFMDQVVRPSLASHGVQIADEESAPAPDSAAGVSGLAAPIGNAILRFRTTGVNRVIFIEAGGALPFLFMPAAESQGFTPRYGLNSENALYFLQGNDPASQLHGSIGMGWYPSDDTNGAARTGTPPEGVCLQLMHQVGYTDSDLPETMGYCDTLFMLKRALDAAPSPTVVGLRTAIEQLGGGYVPASTFSARFGPDRHQQAASAQTLAFDDSCGCFRYTGGTVPIP
jgi:hypothetical protein